LTKPGQLPKLAKSFLPMDEWTHIKTETGTSEWGGEDTVLSYKTRSNVQINMAPVGISRKRVMSRPKLTILSTPELLKLIKETSADLWEGDRPRPPIRDRDKENEHARCTIQKVLAREQLPEKLRPKPRTHSLEI
jgi:hypothetical protein